MWIQKEKKMQDRVHRATVQPCLTPLRISDHTPYIICG